MDAFDNIRAQKNAQQCEDRHDRENDLVAGDTCVRVYDRTIYGVHKRAGKVVDEERREFFIPNRLSWK